MGRRAEENLAINDFWKIVDRHQPDIIFVWHAIGLPKLIFQEAEKSPNIEVVYYLADYQPEIGDEYISYWESKPANLAKRILKQSLSNYALRILDDEGKPIKLNYKHTICVSDFVRERLVSGGFIPSSAIVIHNGIDLSEFEAPDKDQAVFKSEEIRCLLAGRVIHNKGVHTVVDAFARLDFDSLPIAISLTILGDGPDDYLNFIKNKIRQNNLHEKIQLKPPVARSQMPNVLRDHNVLILSSEYDEPLARSIQEAMAMGLLVIGTTTGGSGELLVDKQTGLVFMPGDSKSLADQIIFAAKNPDLVNDLQIAGKNEIEQHFNIQRTVLEIENYFMELMSREKIQAS
jgi:glycosyltransferase involved in cell wall biosynthesis